MSKLENVTGDNFQLMFIKDGLAYSVALTDEQRKAFNLLMHMIPGQINIVGKPIGKVMTLGELRKMEESK